MEGIKVYFLRVPGIVLGVLIRALFHRFILSRPYSWTVTGSNLVVAVGRLVTDAATKGLVVLVYLAAYEVRLFDISMNLWESWVALFFAVEVAYYWLHRYSHEIRWMWAQHSV